MTLFGGETTFFWGFFPPPLFLSPLDTGSFRLQAFPIRANAISKAGQTGGPLRKARREAQAVVSPDHLNAADKITIHQR